MIAIFLKIYLFCMLVSCLIHLSCLTAYWEVEDEEKEISAWMVLTTFFAPLFLLYVIFIFLFKWED